MRSGGRSKDCLNPRWRALSQLKEDTNVRVHGDTVVDPSQALRMSTHPTIMVWFSGTQEASRSVPDDGLALARHSWLPEAVLALDRRRAERQGAVDPVPRAGIETISGATQSGGIQAAVTTMVSAARRAHEERLQREAIWRLIQLTDGMIDEIEELNLRDVRRVSDSWRPLLVLLCASLPFQLRVKFVTRPSPTELLDVLFDIQQALFDLKNARAARRAVNGRARQQRRGGRRPAVRRSRGRAATETPQRRNPCTGESA